MAKKNLEKKSDATPPGGLSRWSRVKRCFQSQSRVPPADLTDQEMSEFAELVSPQGEFHPEIRARFAGLWDRRLERTRGQAK